MSYKEFVRDRYKEGEIVPFYKAPIWWEYSTRTIRVQIIGFHLFFAFIHRFYLWLRLAGWDSEKYLREQLKLRKQDTK